jgi:hypothetical protein
MVRETGIRPHVAPVQVSAAYAGFTRIDFKGSHDRGELDTCHAKPIRRIEQHLGFYFTSFPGWLQKLRKNKRRQRRTRKGS